MKSKRATKLKRPGQFAGAHGSATLDKRIRKAVEADFQQWMIQSLTPDRGYMTPIDNVRALILELVPPNEKAETRRERNANE